GRESARSARGGARSAARARHRVEPRAAQGAPGEHAGPPEVQGATAVGLQGAAGARAMVTAIGPRTAALMLTASATVPGGSCCRRGSPPTAAPLIPIVTRTSISIFSEVKIPSRRSYVAVPVPPP